MSCVVDERIKTTERDLWRAFLARFRASFKNNTELERSVSHHNAIAKVHIMASVVIRVVGVAGGRVRSGAAPGSAQRFWRGEKSEQRGRDPSSEEEGDL